MNTEVRLCITMGESWSAMHLRTGEIEAKLKDLG